MGGSASFANNIENGKIASQTVGVGYAGFGATYTNGGRKICL